MNVTSGLLPEAYPHALVNHYDDHFNLKLTTEQKRQLVEHLKSL